MTTATRLSPSSLLPASMSVIMGRSFDSDSDPLAFMTRPPPNETPEERRIRERDEAEARRVSEEIDEALAQERSNLKKKRPVKVLLLGQSESGKSTTLKNFQMKYSPKAWKQERLLWTSVIQLNLVRNVNTILDIMSREMQLKPVPNDPEPLQFTEKHRILKLRLAPIRSLQKDLERKLGSGAVEDIPSPGDIPAPPMSSAASVVESTTDMDPGFYGTRRDPREFYVRANNTWKDRFRSRSSSTGAQAQDLKEIEETAVLMNRCKDDMKAIWEDETIRKMLKKRKYRLEDSPGFFLHEVDRIAERGYTPSDEDVIRSRLRTLGVQEHKFVFESGRLAGSEWNLYDVGGSRSSRAAWASFFEEVDALIFLAPLNCFDERLVEDPMVNRLQDSYELWKTIVSNKVLSQTQIILFLNKYDLLEKKIERGVKVRSYVPSFGTRENTTESVVKYFEQHFKDVFKKYSPQARPFYLHVTSVVDTQQTTNTLAVVEDSILREHLRRADLL